MNAHYRVRSMTGFAQRRGSARTQEGETGFALALKSVNHRFLDLHLRMPAQSDGLEMKLRRVLKERIARGHVELTLMLERGGDGGVVIDRNFAASYVRSFREVASDLQLSGEPDLNAIVRLPGALTSGGAALDETVEAAVVETAGEVIAALNSMREQEGAALAGELRAHMGSLQQATTEVEHLREAVLRANFTRLQGRIRELAGSHASEDRLLQEAALAADRSDIQEETARMKMHIEHFLGVLEAGGEVGKRLDFLLQEMNREANTMLSKTSGLAGEAMRMTELGLRMKSDIEKSREQVQNLE